MAPGHFDTLSVGLDQPLVTHHWVGDNACPDTVHSDDAATQDMLSAADTFSAMYRKEVMQDAEIAVKYQGYIEREKRIAEKISRLEDLKIPQDFDFDKVSGLSIECRQKLKRYAPATIGQASRISGISPSDISVLLVYFRG